MKSPLQQAKDHILNVCLPLVEPQHKVMVIPCYRRDYEDYQKALALPVVKDAIRARGIKIEFQIVDDSKPGPQIIIATVSDVASGKLDRFLQNP